MTDAVEALGQHVEEKAADELVRGKPHRLPAVRPGDAIVLTWGVSGQGRVSFCVLQLISLDWFGFGLSASVDISSSALGSENRERSAGVKDAKHRRSRRARSGRP